MALGSASTAALDIRAGRNSDEIFRNLTIKMAQYGFNRMIYGATRFYRNANTFKIPPPKARSKIHDKPDAQKVNVKDQKFPQGDGYDFGNPDDFIVLHNHTNGYFERYVTNKIFVSSPSFVWALNNIGEHPFLYRDKEALGNSKDAAVLHQLNEKYGVLAGYTISFGSADRRIRAILSLCATPDLSQNKVNEIWKENRDDIVLLCSVAHDNIMLSPPPLSFPQKLTNKQREVVLLAGYGKQSADIATEIGISVKTVEKHLRDSRYRLGVKNTAQAVMKATILNQI